MERYSQHIMRILAVAGVCVFTILVGLQIYSSLARKNELVRERDDIESRLKEAQIDAMRLRGELEYYSMPENFEKELRARFNYRKEGEKLIIIVPRNSSSSQSTSTQ